MANIKDEYFRYRKINSEIAYGLFRKCRIGSSNRYQTSIHPLILIPALKRWETGYAEVSPPCLQGLDFLMLDLREKNMINSSDIDASYQKVMTCQN